MVQSEAINEWLATKTNQDSWCGIFNKRYLERCVAIGDKKRREALYELLNLGK